VAFWECGEGVSLSDKPGVGFGALISVAVLSLFTGCFLGYGLTLVFSPGNSVTDATPTQSVSVAEATQQPQPTGEPLPTTTIANSPMGDSRSNPAPRGVYLDIGDDMEMAVLNVVRPANDLVQQANQFNETPEPGREYIQVEIGYACKKSSDVTCLFSGPSLSLVGRDGNILNRSFVGIEGELSIADELFGGARKTAQVVYIVMSDDSELVLYYESLFGKAVYFSLK
jgi:hypothetical protein